MLRSATRRIAVAAGLWQAANGGAAAQFVGDATAPPVVRIDEAPPACCFGSWAGTLRGSARNVDAATVRVVVYSHTDLWYVQPYAGSTLPLDAAGRFAAALRGGDRYTALLVGRDFAPPEIIAALPPPDGITILAAVTVPDAQRRIEFAGRLWVVKSAPEFAVGPGPNLWGAGSESVWVDAAGRLHLRLVERDGRWYAAEVYSEDYCGYGRYRFTVASPVDRLDANAVFAGFLYADDGGEMDVEWSRWGDTTSAFDAQFVVHPEQVHPLALGLADMPAEHEIAWAPGAADFSTRLANSDPAAAPLASWSVRSGVPEPRFTRLRFNLWLRNGAPPAAGDETEVVVADCAITTPTDVASARGAGAARLALATPQQGTRLAYRVELPAASAVAIDLFDPRGRRIDTMFSGTLAAGTHALDWQPAPGRLAPGVYFVRARAPGFGATRKLVLLP